MMKNTPKQDNSQKRNVFYLGMVSLFTDLSSQMIYPLVPEEKRATAYGIFNTAIGLALLPASLIMGAVWDQYGIQAAFHISDLFSLIGFLVFFISSKFLKPLRTPSN